MDPVFTKTTQKRSFSLNRKRAFWLVFAKTGSIISGTVLTSQQHTYWQRGRKIRQADRQKDGQVDRQKKRQKDQTDRQAERWTGRQTKKEAERSDRQTDRQKDRQVDRQTGRKIDR
jgi:hypothetical protein